MDRILFFVICMLCICIRSEAAVAAVAANKPGIYQLRQGDTVVVSVWRQDALQRQVVVLPDGSITLPLAGRIEVVGLSTPEVELRIAEKLKEFFPDPVVTVVIAAIDGNRAYVLGKVRTPGSLIISGPITVLQAISLVGGFDKFADEGNIKVIRANPASPNGQEILSVNYSSIILGKNMSTNIQLRAGDIIIVP